MAPKRKGNSANGTTASKSKRQKVDDDVSDGDEEEEEEVVPKKGRAKKPPAKAAKASKAKGPSSSSIKDVNFDIDAENADGNKWNFKIVSWNVNGIRAWIQKGGLDYIEQENPDVFCVMETKCSLDKMPPEATVEGYTNYMLSGDAEGYSGVGLYTKIKPINVSYGIDVEDHDKEGRVITAEFEKFYVLEFFLLLLDVPNAGRKLIRLNYRKQWDIDFRSYLKQLDEKKPVILCGDLNVAHEEIDLANPKTNKRNAGFSQEERDGFGELLSSNKFVDTFRHFHPEEKGAYTFWTYMMNARAKNVGWRLDYFLTSEALTPNLCENVIRKEVLGSDHCPIVLFLH
uniref:DNA repair nuclease/redox regulator APEX1 n=1 Tax=Strigamia maritima TaxID=126957 RepID=T1JHW7_STRMM